MVKHIVLFKLRNDIPEETRRAAALRFKEAIEALPPKIDVIRNIEVGLNMNPDETWTIALYGEFDTLADVRAYATHPPGNFWPKCARAVRAWITRFEKKRHFLYEKTDSYPFGGIAGHRRTCPNYGAGEV